MINKDDLIEIFSHWTFSPEAVAQEVLKRIIFLGKEMYVVAKYLPSLPYEVIKVKVTTMRYNSRTDKKYFSVTGRWARGSYYNGTFSKGSVENTIFIKFDDAKRVCDVKNSVNKS